MNEGAGPLIDTNVVMDLLRARPQARAWFQSLVGRSALSVVTIAELFAGVREGEERVALDRFTGATEIIPVTARAAEMAGLRIRRYGRSHSVTLPDALIAASARDSSRRLATLNAKRFPMIDDVLIPYVMA